MADHYANTLDELTLVVAGQMQAGASPEDCIMALMDTAFTLQMNRWNNAMAAQQLGLGEKHRAKQKEEDFPDR